VIAHEINALVSQRPWWRGSVASLSTQEQKNIASNSARV
jgi:hypothetical protein